MNKTYKSVWNEALGAWVAVSELETSRGKRSKPGAGAGVHTLAAKKTVSSLAVWSLSAVTLAMFGMLGLMPTDALAQAAGSVVQCKLGDGSNSLYCDPTTTASTTQAAGTESVAIGARARATYYRDVALGADAKAQSAASPIQNPAVAVGAGASATGKYATVVGAQATANGNDSIAIGGLSKSLYGQAIAVGTNAETKGVDAVAVGFAASAAAQSTTIGSYAAATGTFASAVGYKSSAVGSNSVAMGHLSAATGTRSVAVGATSAAGDYGVSLGYFANGRPVTKGASAIAIGRDTTSSGKSAIAIGGNTADSLPGTRATNEAAIAIGDQSLSSGFRSTSIGYEANALASNAVAVGTRSQASGASAIALGHGAQATGTQSISIGTGNQVSGNHSGALGDPTIVTGDNSYSVGNNNTLSTKNTFALGNAITTTIGNDVVLGTGSASYATGTATKGTAAYSSETIEGITYNYAGNTAPANVISVGATGAEGRIQNVAAGLVSTTSTDAINGSQLYDTNKALGNLAGNTAAALGGGTTLNPDGTLEAPSYTVTTNPSTGTTTTVNNVGDALAGLDQAVNQPLTFVDDAGVAVVRPLGSTLNVVGGVTDPALLSDGNIGVVADPATGSLNVKLAQDINLTPDGSVTVGDTVVDTTGITIAGSPADPTTNVSLTQDGLNNGGNQIVNVASGVTDAAGNPVTDLADAVQTNAVNVGDLKNVNDGLTAAGLNFTANDATAGDVHRDLGQTLGIMGEATTAGTYSGANVKTVTDPATGTIQLQMADSPKFGNVTINADGSGKISGVTAGTALTDAVNVSQLTTAATGARTEVKAGTNVTSVDKSMGTAGQDIYTIHAKGATTSAGSTAVTVTPTAKADNVTDYAVDLAQSTKDDIQKGVDAKEVVDTKGLTFTGDTGTTGVKKLGETVAVTGDANITTTADASGVQVALKRDLNLDSVTLGNTSINTTGLTIVGGPSMTNLGVNAGGLKITNVANGVENNDAVNVSQLNQLKTDGLNFSGNEGSTVHRDLGQTLAIRGLASAAGSYSGTNLKTVTDSATGAIQLQMADSPKFGNVTINADGGGKITGVTAGTALTDAVNVSQLNNVQQTANKGWNLATDAGTASNVKPGDTVQLTNTDGNILISNTGNTATFNLANNLNVDSVNAGGTIINNQGLTAGNTTVTSNGLTIQGGPSVTQGGINAAGTTITNVKAGVADTDAVNVSQLKDVANVANAGWDIGNADGKVGNVAPGKRVDFVAGNTSTRVDVTQDATGTSKVTVSAAPSALQYTTTNTAAGGNTPAADPFTSTSQVTLVGPNGDTSSGVTINNVAPATLSADSKQAVNGSQLHQAGQNIANVLGGSSTYNATTNTVNAGLNVGGKTYTTVNDALQAVDLTANKGWNLQANGGTSSHIAGNDTVNVVDGKNTTVSLRDKQLQVNVVDNPTFTGEVTLQGGTTVGDHLTVQKGATVNMGGNTINNVAPGEVSATSTQAVNGSQLFAVDQKISNLGDQINGVAKDAYAGVANAIATASIPQVTMPGAKGVAVAGGTYHGQSSMAVGVSGMSDNGKWIFKGNLSTNTQGHLGAGVGALYQWR